MPLPKSASAQAEELREAAKIAQAVSFSAHLRVSPTLKFTTRDLPDYDTAAAEAARLVREHSKFGRRGIVYAISAKGVETPCTPELVALAAQIGAAT